MNHNESKPSEQSLKEARDLLRTLQEAETKFSLTDAAGYVTIHAHSKVVGAIAALLDQKAEEKRVVEAEREQFKKDLAGVYVCQKCSNKFFSLTCPYCYHQEAEAKLAKLKEDNERINKMLLDISYDAAYPSNIVFMDNGQEREIEWVTGDGPEYNSPSHWAVTDDSDELEKAVDENKELHSHLKTAREGLNIARTALEYLEGGGYGTEQPAKVVRDALASLPKESE